jgi:hypothetical protein
VLSSSIVCFLGFDTTTIFDMSIVVNNDLWSDIGWLCPQEPNMTKPPLQVLAVIKGNSEKIRFGG